MSAIEFYYMPESPPCRAVEMVANMIGINLNKHYVNLFLKEQMKEDFVKINPQHKVPFIVDGDVKLGESRAIMAYLVNRYKPNDALYPIDPVQRAAIDELMYFDATTLYPSGSNLFRPMLFEGKKDFDPECDQAYRANLKYLDDRLELGGYRFLLGNSLTIADITICSSLSFASCFDFNFEPHKHLLVYMNSLKESILDYSKVNDSAVENTKNYIKSRLGSG